MINVVDRVPTYPNRIKVTKSDGTSEYVTWERADEPTVPGTPINKALFDSIVEDIGLNANKTVYVSTAGSDTLGDGTAANPYATITKALNSIPKNLNGFEATINIAAGVYDEDVSIYQVYGGILRLSGSVNASVQIRSLNISYGSLVHVPNINLVVAGSVNGSAIQVTNAKLICFNPVSVTGQAYIGVHLTLNGFAVFTELSVSNSTFACVQAADSSNVFISALSGDNNSANGLVAISGSSIGFNAMSATLAVRYSTASGGRIYSGAQTSIPNY